MGINIKDWKGNYAKVGDEIIFVGVKPVFGKISIGFISAEDGFKTVCEIEPKKHCWIVSEGYKVVYLKGRIGLSTVFDGITYTQLLYDDIVSDENVVVCIKGVSDSKEDYFNSI